MRAEDALQIAVADFLRVALLPGTPWTSIEHAGRMTPQQGAVRKAKGVRRGLPDLIIWNDGATHCIELKTKTGVQSAEQRAFQSEITDQGACYRVCRSVEDVETALREWRIPFRATLGRARA